MKRTYVIVLLVIAAIGLLGLAIAEHPGYVLIAYSNFRYESSLWATPVSYTHLTLPTKA